MREPHLPNTGSDNPLPQMSSSGIRVRNGSLIMGNLTLRPGRRVRAAWRRLPGSPGESAERERGAG